jgi:hypothetical protein
MVKKNTDIKPKENKKESQLQTQTKPNKGK